MNTFIRRKVNALSCILALAFMTALSGCGQPALNSPRVENPRIPPAAASNGAAVSIDNFTFTPKTLTVTRGTTVTWTNRDDVPHTATSTSKLFNSGTLDTDQSYTYTFNDAG